MSILKIRNDYNELLKTFQEFKITCEKETYEKLNDQFKKELDNKLDDVKQELFVKEKTFKELLTACETKLREQNELLRDKESEIESIRAQHSQQIRKRRDSTQLQVDNLVDQLNEKDLLIEVSF